MNRRLSVLKQWSRERFSSKARTEPSDDFVELEDEVRARFNGTQAIHRSFAAYVKWLCKRQSDGNKNKQLALARVAADMHDHAHDLGNESDYGRCLMSMARSSERLSRAQEAYAANVNDCWLESLDRSLQHIRLCQDARKVMESQRLAYDASRARMTKARKQDMRLFDEVNDLKQAYEESHDNVLAHMLEIRDAEEDTVADLAGFLDAQLAYHKRCVDILQQTKDNWPLELSDVDDSHSLSTSIEPRYRRAQSLASTANILNSTLSGAAVLSADTNRTSTSSQETFISTDEESEDHHR